MNFIVLLACAFFINYEATSAGGTPTPVPSSANGFTEADGTYNYDGWDYVAVSANGQYAYVANNVQIINTSDFGQSWYCCHSVAESEGLLSSIAVDNTGQKIVYVTSGGYVKISTDYGRYYSTSSYNQSMEWRSIATSMDFTIMYLVESNNDYLSKIQ